jgi:hypothetical protein
MTHASRQHTCELCGQVGNGNGFRAAHGRAHVRRGEAVELVRHYGMVGVSPSRLFIDATDRVKIADLEARGFTVERQP